MPNNSEAYHKDEKGRTQAKRGRDLREKYPLPEGGRVILAYPNGLDAPLWSRATVRATAIYDGDRIGVYSSYARARNAIIKVSEGEEPAKPAKLKKKRKSRKRSKAKGSPKLKRGATRKRHSGAHNPMADAVAKAGSIEVLQATLKQQAEDYRRKADALDRAAAALTEVR